MRILATQETDWISRNPIVHHRLLEWLSTHGADVTVIDYDIDWASKAGPLLQRRHEFAGIHKYFADSRIRLIRPGMIRIGLIARLSWLFGNWRDLRTIFRNAKPDVVVAYGISNALVTLAASRAAGRPFVYHVMDALHTHAESFPVRAIARGSASARARCCSSLSDGNTSSRVCASWSPISRAGQPRSPGCGSRSSVAAISMTS